jgi:uncharacterized protein UPF0547
MSETKTCPDCAEVVKAEARVCRFCGYRFDVAEEHRREQAEEAARPWWKKAARAFADDYAKTREDRKRRHPVSCCGCSCGTTLATFAFVALVTAGPLGIAGSVVVGLGASVIAAHAADPFLRYAPIRRAMRLPQCPSWHDDRRR